MKEVSRIEPEFDLAFKLNRDFKLIYELQEVFLFISLVSFFDGRGKFMDPENAIIYFLLMNLHCELVRGLNFGLILSPFLSKMFEVLCDNTGIKSGFVNMRSSA